MKEHISQVHAWAEKMEREQERENNNNTVKRDLLRTPPPRCKDFLNLIPTPHNKHFAFYCVCPFVFTTLPKPSVVIKYN